MRTIERTSQFKRDYKRESKGRYRTTLDASLEPIFDALASDLPLDRRHCDHPLDCDRPRWFPLNLGCGAGLDFRSHYYRRSGLISSPLSAKPAPNPPQPALQSVAGSGPSPAANACSSARAPRSSPGMP